VNCCKCGGWKNKMDESKKNSHSDDDDDDELPEFSGPLVSRVL